VFAALAVSRWIEQTTGWSIKKFTFLVEQQFPASAVLLYGAFFTALLLLVYVPAHLSLRSLCIDLR
jgi:hypothetical protein